MSNTPAFDDSNTWHVLFSKASDDEIESLAVQWFRLWDTKMLKIRNQEQYNELTLRHMMTLHTLSNKTHVPMDGVFKLLEKGVHYHTHRTIQSTLAMRGWNGLCIRCWTDPIGFAGMLTWLNQQDIPDAYLGSIADYPFAMTKLREAILVHPSVIHIEWVQVAITDYFQVFARQNNEFIAIFEHIVRAKEIMELTENPLFWAYYLRANRDGALFTWRTLTGNTKGSEPYASMLGLPSDSLIDATSLEDVTQGIVARRKLSLYKLPDLDL